MRAIIRIGARGSRLAQIQARIVCEKLQNVAPEQSYQVVSISTAGDRDRRNSLARMGGRGVFVKELEDALRHGDIDLAVHSAKDLPANMPSAFALAAIPARDAVEDVFISRHGRPLQELPFESTVATGSPRRRALLLNLKPDLHIVDLRGNVDTRLRKLDAGHYDAIVLARAGLVRLGVEDRITAVLPADQFLPAPGQGALALEIRADDNDMRELASQIDLALDHACVEAERSLMAALHAGCAVPLGAWARWIGQRMRLDAVILDKEGQQALRFGGDINLIHEAKKLGQTVADGLLSLGAGHLISDEFER